MGNGIYSGRHSKLYNLHDLHKGRVLDTLKVSAAEFQRNIGRYQDLALRRPVAVTRNRRESTVPISREDYERLKRRDRQVLGLEDFTDADIAALEASRSPAEAHAYDREIKD